MGVFATNPVTETVADGYLKGQIWNRPEAKKKYLQLIVKTVRDNSLTDNVNISPYAAWARKLSSTEWERNQGFLPVDADTAFTNRYAFDFNAIDTKLVGVHGYDIYQLSKSFRYFVILFSASPASRSSPEPTPVSEFTPAYATLSVATADKRISPGLPLLTTYLADANLYPTGAKKNIAKLNTPANKHFAQVDLSANDDIFTGHAILWFGLEFDLQALDLAPRVVPNILPSSLPLPPTVPPQTTVGMFPWADYLGIGGNVSSGYGNPYSVTIGADPTIALAP